METYPGLSAPMIQRIYQTLGKDRLTKILEMLIQDPYLYTGGWPDLTLFNTERLFFSEVKTKDGLTARQVETIPKIKKILDLDVKILRIIN